MDETKPSRYELYFDCFVKTMFRFELSAVQATVLKIFIYSRVIICLFKHRAN